MAVQSRFDFDCPGLLQLSCPGFFDTWFYCGPAALHLSQGIYHAASLSLSQKQVPIENNHPSCSKLLTLPQEVKEARGPGIKNNAMATTEILKHPEAFLSSSVQQL